MILEGNKLIGVTQFGGNIDGGVLFQYTLDLSEYEVLCHFDDEFKNGIHSLIDYENRNDLNLRSSISAWAYGLSVAMDYFETDDAINKDQVIVIGHSRLGKAAVWAGASDQRFAMLISNDSGC